MPISRRRLSALLPTGLVILSAALAAPCAAQTAVAAAEAPAAARTGAQGALPARDWSRKMWDAARVGDLNTFTSLLSTPIADENDPRAASVRASAAKLKASLDQREADRAKRRDEVRAELDKTLAEPRTDLTLSKALISVVELHMLATNKESVLRDPVIAGVIAEADKAARAAEDRGDWLASSELFFRLNAIFEETGTYKDDSERQNRRLTMLRLYVPQRLWELRNTRQLAAGLEKLPPYNPAGDDFHTKVAPITQPMIVSAVTRAGLKHVEQVQLRDIVASGLRTLRTMAQTADLRQSFQGLADADKREAFLRAVDREEEKVRNTPVPLDFTDVDAMLARVLDANRSTVGIMDQALLHEFGNGAMEALDPFSAVIWPDELARFNRTTQGKLIGIGVEIQFDELSNVKVVTPLEGGPAQRVGVRAGDVIKYIDGKSAYGITLDQAVDLITGKAGTTVNIKVERKDPSKPADQAASEVEFAIVRAEVELKSVKGWKRDGAHDDAWNWFIDPANKIGYARLTGFTEGTTREFDRAIKAMKADGVQGLILDLRFNPGGLLDEAVKVVNRFVDSGRIVSTQLPGNRIERQEFARRNLASLSKLPVVVLINEGSASASEIVSGAIQDYARRDTVKAVLVGNRSFGKGSVQDVTALGGSAAAMKLTTQYYLLPDGRLIHRKEGAKEWGVPADLTIDMLPQQISDSLILRRNADVLPLDDNGKPVLTNNDPKADPEELIAKGLDVQLHAALVLLQAQTLATGEQAAKDR